MPETGELPLALRDAISAAAILAVDPVGIGGVLLKGGDRTISEAWIALLRPLLGEQTPLRRLPIHITDDRLLGGLDLTATMAAGRPMIQRGLLCETDGGILVIPMAERLPSAVAARIARVLDSQEVALEREGFAERMEARISIVAFDESIDRDEMAPAALRERLACHVDLAGVRELPVNGMPTHGEIACARVNLHHVHVGEDIVSSLCAAALALGIRSLAAPFLAVRVACASAALRGGNVVKEDVELAARLVLAPRATMIPADQEQQEQSEPEPPPPEESSEENNSRDESEALKDVVLAAAASALPDDILSMLRLNAGARKPNTRGGAGPVLKSRQRGRPVGVRAGKPGEGARLAIVETLRAAAPRQRLRQSKAREGRRDRLIDVRPDDLRISRRRQRTGTTTIFVVDASGSAALHRLAEAKGAIELMLADCYVRRDEVALIAFGGRGAELILPPTRALARAKRNLAGLPGGGGTPLAAGLDAAAALAGAVRRKGSAPGVVLLTDGCANLTRDGKPGRAQAQSEAIASARALRATGTCAVVIDTSPRSNPQVSSLAEAMGAAFLALPHADARALSQAVRERVLPNQP